MFLKKITIFCTLVVFSPVYARSSWSGQEYAVHSKSQAIDAASQIAGLEGAFTQILDMGCGSGGVTKLLAGKFPQANITAIDPDDSMLGQAKLTLQGLARITLHKGSAQNFQAKEQYDLVTAFHVMHWIPRHEQQQALKNLRKHMKKDAVGVFILAPSKAGLPFQRALDQQLASEKYKDEFRNFATPQTFYTVDEYRGLLEQATFFVDMIGYFYNEKPYQNVQELQNWVKQWLPHYKLFSAKNVGRAEEFLKDLMNAFVSFSGDKIGDELRWGEYVLSVKVRAI